MTLRPCLVCGEPTERTRCPEHHVDPKPSARARGYSAAWDRLSRRARKLQPFCTDCGRTDDLQTDHTPQAWARHDAGKVIRLTDVAVVCGDCNRKRGAARVGLTTRGDAPPRAEAGPAGEAKFTSENRFHLGEAS